MGTIAFGMGMFARASIIKLFAQDLEPDGGSAHNAVHGVWMSSCWAFRYRTCKRNGSAVQRIEK